MLKIQNVDTVSKRNLNIERRRTRKHQILLYDTKRRFGDFVMKIKHRNNGRYDDVPHYIVTKNGQVYNMFNTKYWSHTLGEDNVDKRFIKIAIENLGWLNKNTINGFLTNWINDAYRLEPYTKSWRGYYFWDKYTDEQMNSLIQLCYHVCEKENIPFQIVRGPGYVSNLSNFKGIVCKSNFTDIYKDINPSFNFKMFNEYEEKN